MLVEWWGSCKCFFLSNTGVGAIPAMLKLDMVKLDKELQEEISMLFSMTSDNGFWWGLRAEKPGPFWRKQEQESSFSERKDEIKSHVMLGIKPTEETRSSLLI